MPKVFQCAGCQKTMLTTYGWEHSEFVGNATTTPVNKNTICETKSLHFCCHIFISLNDIFIRYLFSHPLPSFAVIFQKILLGGFSSFYFIFMGVLVTWKRYLKTFFFIFDIQFFTVMCDTRVTFCRNTAHLHVCNGIYIWTNRSRKKVPNTFRQHGQSAMGSEPLLFFSGVSLVVLPEAGHIPTKRQQRQPLLYRTSSAFPQAE